jgi:hypothetical protein
MTKPLIFFLLAACGDNDAREREPIHAPPASTGTEDSAETMPVSETSSAYVEIVPGRSIGPIRMGMSREEVTALGILTTHPQYSAMTIPTTAYYGDDGRVFQMEISFTHAPSDLRVGDVVIPKTSTAQETLALLADCTETEPREGGTIYLCRGGALQVVIGSGNPNEVWIRLGPPPSS